MSIDRRAFAGVCLILLGTTLVFAGGIAVLVGGAGALCGGAVGALVMMCFLSSAFFGPGAVMMRFGVLLRRRVFATRFIEHLFQRYQHVEVSLVARTLDVDRRTARALVLEAYERGLIDGAFDEQGDVFLAESPRAALPYR
jgi:hypothetical protein